MADHYKKYLEQKKQAEKRNIDWMFTYETWLEKWGQDIQNRGKEKNKLVMARYKDLGPYSPDNTYICTHSQNAKDAFTNKRFKTPHRTTEICIDGKWTTFKSISAAARHFNVNPGTILNSYRQTGTYKGMSIRLLDKTVKTLT